MSVPEILPRESESRGAVAAGAVSFEEVELDFSLEKQLLDQWCWAAVTEGLERAYGIKPRRRQCAIVSATLGEKCCPEGVNAAPCNKAQHVGAAVSKVYRDREVQPRGRTFDFIRGRISAGFPVVAQLDWGNGGSSHVVVITGFKRTPATIDLIIWDPWTGERSEEPFDYFSNSYRDKARWVVSIGTRGASLRARRSGEPS